MPFPRAGRHTGVGFPGPFPSVLLLVPLLLGLFLRSHSGDQVGLRHALVVMYWPVPTSAADTESFMYISWFSFTDAKSRYNWRNKV